MTLQIHQVVHGALGVLGTHVQSHAQVSERSTAEDENTHLVSTQFMIVGLLFVILKIIAIHNAVRFGLNGPVGVIVLSLVMVVLKHELDNVKMVNRTIARDHQPTKSNVTVSPVSPHLYTGEIVALIPIRTRLKQSIIKFLVKGNTFLMKKRLRNVLRIVEHTGTVLVLKQRPSSINAILI